MSLFDTAPPEASDKGRPLAERMRPRSLDEFVGQEHILAPGKPLRVQIERDDIGEDHRCDDECRVHRVLGGALGD